MIKPGSYKDFQETLVQHSPAKGWSAALQALWWDTKGNWHKAHDLVDGSSALHADWIHAYLHRKEGDRWNAEYWYRKANRPFPEVDLEEERVALIRLLLTT